MLMGGCDCVQAAMNVSGVVLTSTHPPTSHMLRSCTGSMAYALVLCFCCRVILCKTADLSWNAQARILTSTWTSMQMNSGSTTSGEHLSIPSLAI